MKLLINLCAHDGIISHYTGVGTIVKRYIKMFQMILEKRGYEYAINLYTPEYHSNSFGYSAYTHEVHKQMKNVNIIQISNGSNGAVNYGTIKDWKLLSKNTANAINSLDISNYDLVVTISNDTPFPVLSGAFEYVSPDGTEGCFSLPHSSSRKSHRNPGCPEIPLHTDRPARAGSVPVLSKSFPLSPFRQCPVPASLYPFPAP